ncbi:hypothetical protein ACFQ3F_12320 [Nocardioides ginsengisoli]|uniref:Uncharacterized protein n=1 Tax=Nocardioides ginsengisoli TaxID=363868 RepID=A0ABW3W0G8_9ACTN
MQDQHDDEKGDAMSEINADQFPGFSENHYQHGMHSLAWISLWVIVGLGVAAGIFGFVWGVSH